MLHSCQEVIQDVCMNCQPALHRELDRPDATGRFELDLATSGRPWPAIVASHARPDLIIGPGLVRFSIAVERSRLCPYQERPLVHFGASRIDGTRVTFACIDRTDDELQQAFTEADERLAFRLAAGWEVKSRWEAYLPSVFVNLVAEFKRVSRPSGLLPGDLTFDPRRSAWVLRPYPIPTGTRRLTISTRHALLIVFDLLISVLTQWNVR
jgi:hypothetical protein